MITIPWNLSPQWVKVTKSYTDFAVASLTNDISIYTLPIKGFIHNVQIVVNTAFSGGLIASYTVSVGKAGNLVKYAIATNVFTGATLPLPSGLSGIDSVSATTDIRAAVISTVGLLNAATAGSVSIYLLVSTLE